MDRFYSVGGCVRAVSLPAAAPGRNAPSAEPEVEAFPSLDALGSESAGSLQMEALVSLKDRIVLRAVWRQAFVLPILRKIGITRSRWAADAGVDPAVVYDCLSGKSRARPESRNVLAEALKLQEAYLPE